MMDEDEAEEEEFTVPCETLGRKQKGVVVLQRIRISKKSNDTKSYTSMYHVFG